MITNKDVIESGQLNQSRSQCASVQSWSRFKQSQSYYRCSFCSYRSSTGDQLCWIADTSHVLELKPPVSWKTWTFHNKLWLLRLRYLQHSTSFYSLRERRLIPYKRSTWLRLRLAFVANTPSPVDGLSIHPSDSNILPSVSQEPVAQSLLRSATFGANREAVSTKRRNMVFPHPGQR